MGETKGFMYLQDAFSDPNSGRFKFSYEPDASLVKLYSDLDNQTRS